MEEDPSSVEVEVGRNSIVTEDPVASPASLEVEDVVVAKAGADNQERELGADAENENNDNGTTSNVNEVVVVMSAASDDNCNSNDGNGTSQNNSIRNRGRQAKAPQTTDSAPAHIQTMHTCSYEQYDSEEWNQRKVDIKVKDDDNQVCGAHLRAEHQRKVRIIGGVAIFGIGAITASVGYLIGYIIHNIEKWHVGYLGPQGIDTDMSGSVYGKYLGFSVLFALLSFLPVAYIRPVAAGSGIAEAKAVLNGIQIPRCTELISAACKGVSVIFAVVSTLPAGLEGPLIFIGMALGENIYRLIPRKYAELRSWRMRRDLAAIGTAAGVAVAFVSPIGGILFAAEEGASYLTSRLLSQCFCAAITVIIFDYFYSIIGRNLSLGQQEHFAYTLTRFNGLDGHEKVARIFPTFAFYDYAVIAFVGACGGFMGACFVEASKLLSKLRGKYITSTWKKCVEVLVLTVTSASLLAWLPTLTQISRCLPLDKVTANRKIFVQLNCGDDEYNDLATLLRVPLTDGINLLFWEGPEAFSTVSCLVAGATILIILLVTFGVSVAMGIFVPLLYSGAAFGRAWATFFPEGTFDVTTYAVVGSAAALNGVIRVLVSLTVILMETTNLATFVSPIMIVCLASRWVGNLVFGGEGVYDEILHLRSIPFLEAEPPELFKREPLRARDIMSKEFIELETAIKVGEVISTLHDHPQLDFLVTDGNGALVGSIRRASLIAFLWDKKYWSQNLDLESSNARSQDQQDYSGLSYDLDRAEGITNKELADHFEGEDGEYKNMFLNIAYCMTLAPITFVENGSAERAYELFRTHGLRQLIIIDEHDRKPVGVITRHIFLNALGGENSVASSSQIERAESHQCDLEQHLP